MKLLGIIDSLKWKLLVKYEKVSSSNVLEVDMTQYKEVAVVWTYSNVNSDGTVINKKYSIHVPVIALEIDRKSFTTGSYQNSTNNKAYFCCYLGLGSVGYTTYNAYFNETNVGSSTSCEFYVR